MVEEWTKQLADRYAIVNRKLRANRLIDGCSSPKRRICYSTETDDLHSESGRSKRRRQCPEEVLRSKRRAIDFLDILLRSDIVLGDLLGSKMMIHDWWMMMMMMMMMIPFLEEQGRGNKDNLAHNARRASSPCLWNWLSIICAVQIGRLSTSSSSDGSVWWQVYNPAMTYEVLVFGCSFVVTMVCLYSTIPIIALHLGTAL